MIVDPRFPVPITLDAPPPKEDKGRMTHGVGIVERAFQLASDCLDLKELTGRLKSEGYVGVDAHLGGSSIRGDLRKRFRR